MTKIDLILAENVRKRREMLGFTREELAKRAGLSLSGMQRIEKATRWPAPETVEAIAKALDMKPWALFIPMEG